MNDQAYTVEPTHVGRDHWKKWEAKTAVVLPGTVSDDLRRAGVRVINLTTYRTDRGLLVTTARVALRSGNAETSALGIGGGGDYSKKVASEPRARVTEKDIREQHTRAVAKIPEIVAEVVAYYAPKEAEAA